METNEQNSVLQPETEQTEENSKKKAPIKENEASVIRWIIAAALGVGLGLLLEIIVSLIITLLPVFFPSLGANGEYAVVTGHLGTFATFTAFYLGFIIMLKLVAKTSVKAFVLGADAKKINFKSDVLVVAGLYLLGLILTALPTIGNVSRSSLAIKPFLMMLVITILLAWMQTTWEEYLFRGFPLRLLCKNNIGMNTKSWIAAIVTSLLFMAAHIPNPEVQTLTGISRVFMIAQYGLAGFLMFLCDMLTGSILAGIIIHWVNNFFCFAILSADVSAGGLTTLLVDKTPLEGVSGFFTTLFAYVPVLIYLIIRYRKKKAAESVKEET